MQTQAYKRTVSGSIGAGVGSLFAPNGRTYYILEHRVSSKYHKAGESQQIIVNQIELGRAAECQVRFDESFATVSRRHAAIIKDGNNWKLVQLSKTNSTFLNGQKISTEWYLQNGDEIQLSVNGPKLGFIVPTGKQASVGSIGLSRRLSLFRQQALRPYRRALTALSILLVLAIGCGIGYSVYFSNDFTNKLAKVDKRYVELFKHVKLQDKKIDAWKKNAPRISGGSSGTVINGVNLDEAKKDIYFLMAAAYIELDGEKKQFTGWTGAGFLLNDGSFVTARHCVEGWFYDFSDNEIMAANVLTTTYPDNVKVYSEIRAMNMEGKEIRLTSKQFKIDRSRDSKQVAQTDENGNPLYIRVVVPDKTAWGGDWAVAKTSLKGRLTADYELSANLKAGTKLILLGFPRTLGVGDGQQSIIEPIYNSLEVARNGLNESRCIMTTSGSDHGNSGGPVLVSGKSGKLAVVGIVSRGDAKSEHYNHMVPVYNIQK
ncbi:MAG: FHA domain-containing protein [Bacteroidales bacterium]|nr:FHA domain-containing protein [Bacteroidales bacterium]